MRQRVLSALALTLFLWSASGLAAFVHLSQSEGCGDSVCCGVNSKSQSETNQDDNRPRRHDSAHCSLCQLLAQINKATVVEVEPSLVGFNELCYRVTAPESLLLVSFGTRNSIIPRAPPV